MKKMNHIFIKDWNGKRDAEKSKRLMIIHASELVPWIRTFLCRITEIHFSNKILETQFKRDIQKMYELYDLEGGEVQ